MTAILLAICLTLAACGPVVAPEVENGKTAIAEYIKITAAEAKNMIDNEAVTKVVFRVESSLTEMNSESLPLNSCTIRCKLSLLRPRREMLSP